MRLTFKLGNELAPGNKFDLEFYENCNQIVGENTTGKTYIVEALKDALYNYRQGIRGQIKNLNNGLVEVIDLRTSPSIIHFIKFYKGYIICIDNANQILHSYPQLRRIIAHDAYNYYLLFSLRELGLHTELMSTLSVKSTPQPDGTFLFTLEEEW